MPAIFGSDASNHVLSRSGKLAWITGAGGLIGSNLARIAPKIVPDWTVRALTRQELELTDSTAVRSRFHSEHPDLIIHCAALSHSSECQEKPALARQLNVAVTALLASLAADIALFFFSTDLVFDGQRGNYDESDAVNPLSVYAETKVAAEQLVLTNSRHTVIRTSLTGGQSPTGSRGFNEQLRRAWQAGQTVTLFTDEFRSPMAASVTSRVVWEMAKQNASGLYHVAGSERLSRSQIGRLIAMRWPHLNPKMEFTTLKQFSGAPRPPDSSLNCAKAQALLSFQLPGLTEWLAQNPQAVF